MHQTTGINPVQKETDSEPKNKFSGIVLFVKLKWLFSLFVA